MSKLKELIQKLCPDGVEYKKLGEICKILRGKRLTTKDLVPDGKFPVYHGGIEPIGYYSTNNRTANSTMIINVGASAGTIGFCNIDFWSSDGCFCFTHNNNINQRYLFFVLQSMEPAIKSKVRKAGIPTLDNKDVERITIPVPPLPVQEEIVRILDLFTDLAAELQAELQARREQYEYYRDKLLTFDKVSRGGILNVTWMTMSEIGDFYGGLSGKSKSDFVNGNSKYATYMNVYKNLALNTYATDMVKIAAGEKQNTIQYGDVLFTGSSETPDECGMSSVVTEEVYEPIYLNSFCFGFRPYDKSLFSPDFLKHLLRSKAMRTEITKTANGVTRFNVSKKSMGKILLPIPPYKEQKRLATILDKFETLVNDLAEGLPAEMAAVQEQYEYYRNKLLSFPRLAAGA